MQQISRTYPSCNAVTIPIEKQHPVSALQDLLTIRSQNRTISKKENNKINIIQTENNKQNSNIKSLCIKTTSNIKGLIPPIKSDKIDEKTRPRYMGSTRDPL